MESNFADYYQYYKFPPEIIEISSDEEEGTSSTSETTVEPTPIPTLSEYLGQTYRIFYGGEFHPNYDRQLRKFRTYAVAVPEIPPDDDSLPDECRLVIDEDSSSRVELLVINVKVLFDGEPSLQPEMNFTVQQQQQHQSETASLMHRINDILYGGEKMAESEDDDEVREE